jgi:DNA modification methylase
MPFGSILRADALHMPLADNSVDLIVTSPPYFALRSYRDGEEHYASQLGSEPSPLEFLAALWRATAEMKRVLKPSGSIFVNLGDKYSQRVALRDSSHQDGLFDRPELRKDWLRDKALGRTRMPYQNVTDEDGSYIPEKSLMGLPWRYAIGCIDQLGLILRAEIVWEKPNGLPESVADRVRRNHEQWFHLTKEGRYFSGVDEIREAHETARHAPGNRSRGAEALDVRGAAQASKGLSGHLAQPDREWGNPLGKLPGSVWTIATEPLIISQEIRDHYSLPEHFAAFPQELPRRLILGWSPSGICTTCGEGRRPVSTKTGERGREPGGGGTYRSMKEPGAKDTNLATAALEPRAIIGYACACTPRTSHRGKQGDWKAGREVMSEHGSDDFHSPGNAVPRRPGGFGTKVPSSAGEWEYHLDGWAPPPTRPAVVLDPFCGTGTTVGVAKALGRYGVGLDLSSDYTRLARWRVFQSGHFAKTVKRTNEANQGSLL